MTLEVPNKLNTLSGEIVTDVVTTNLISSTASEQANNQYEKNEILMGNILTSIKNNPITFYN